MSNNKFTFDGDTFGISYDAMESAMKQGGIGEGDKLDKFDAESRQKYEEDFDKKKSDATDEITTSIKQSNKELISYLSSLSTEMNKNTQNNNSIVQSFKNGLKEFSSYMTDSQEIIKQNMGEGSFGRIGSGLAQAFGGASELFGMVLPNKKDDVDEPEDELKKANEMASELKSLNATIDKVEETLGYIPDSLQETRIDLEESIKEQSLKVTEIMANDENNPLFNQLDNKEKSILSDKISEELAQTLLGNPVNTSNIKSLDLFTKNEENTESINDVDKASSGLMDLSIPTGRVMSPKTIPEGVKAIYDQLTDINEILKDGIGVSKGDDSDDSGPGMLSGLMMKYGPMIASSIVSGIGTAIGAIGSGASALASGAMSVLTTALASPAVLLPMAGAAGLAIGEGIARSGVLGEEMAKGLQVSDIIKGIFSEKSIREIQEERVNEINEENIDTKLTEGQYARTINDYSMDKNEQAEFDKLKESLLSGGNLNDTVIGQNFRQNLQKVDGVDIDSGGLFGDDDISFNKLGIDDDFENLSEEQLMTLFKLSKISKNGKNGMDQLESRYNQRMETINTIGQQQANSRQNDANELFNSKYSTEKLSLTKDTTTEREAGISSMTTEQIKQGVIEAQKELIKDPDMIKEKENNMRMQVDGLQESLR
jgi:hypothetical protein